MNILEKILGEIKARKEEWSKGVPTEYEKNVCQGIEIVEEIVEEHLKCSGWIPVEERLPEDVGGELYPMQLVTLENGDVTLGFYRNDDGEWLTRMSQGEHFYTSTHIVTAWMPLPEPYKGE